MPTWLRRNLVTSVVEPSARKQIPVFTKKSFPKGDEGCMHVNETWIAKLSHDTFSCFLATSLSYFWFSVSNCLQFINVVFGQFSNHAKTNHQVPKIKSYRQCKKIMFWNGNCFNSRKRIIVYYGPIFLQ